MYNEWLVAEKKSSRIQTFDLLRGYFLVAIILDHLDFFPNGLDWWSARGSLYVTTAEGFFLISGIVLGIVRGSKLIDLPFHTVTRLLFKRGIQLYVTSAVLILLFTLLGWWFFIDNPGLKNGIAPLGTNFFEVLWKTLTLQYFYGWADYLRLYAIFLFISPLAMWLLRKGYWYVVLIASFCIWLLFPSSLDVPDTTQELLQPLSWQLIFFSGLTIGFHWKTLTRWWNERLSSRGRTITIAGILAATAITLIVDIIITFGPKYFDLHAIGATNEFQSYLYAHFFDKERLPLPRLALFFVWFWAAFYLFHRFESHIKRWLGWLLLPFGTNSLYVYTTHAVILFFALLWLHKSTTLMNFLIAVSIIALIRIAIHYKFLMKIIPR
jgi:hypothetical protein